MTSISDFYVVKYTDEIGRGAFGRVYSATRKLDGKMIAVKVIARNSLNKETLKSIANEIKTLKTLDHPHIVKLYDMYEEARHFFLAMELVEGGELFDRITKKQCYSEKDARELCKTILSAIKHCHDLNIVHRDLKPENLLMSKDDDDADVKLVDFGFADIAENDSSLSGLLGTPAYMAPEIWSSKPYGKPVDMWSFGVITYILLGGYPPFSDDRKERLARRIQTGTFEFHLQYWGNVSDEAKDFITKLLQIDTSKRLTVNQALQHSWLHVDQLELRDLFPTLSQLKEFNAKRRLRAAVKAVVAVKRINRAFNLTSSSKNTPENSPREDPDHHAQALSEIIRQHSGSSGNQSVKAAIKDESANSTNSGTVPVTNSVESVSIKIKQLRAVNERLNGDIAGLEDTLSRLVISADASPSQKDFMERERQGLIDKVSLLIKNLNENLNKIVSMHEIE